MNNLKNLFQNSAGNTEGGFAWYILGGSIIAALVLGSILTLSFRFLRYTPLIEPVIDDIAPQEAYENIQHDPNKVVFIDVRSQAEYKKAHAEGSINVPIHTLYEERLKLPRNTDTEIYLICTGGRLAGVAYGYLEHYGFRNIRRVENGLSGWNQAGLPIINEFSDNSEIPEALDRPFE